MLIEITNGKLWQLIQRASEAEDLTSDEINKLDDNWDAIHRECRAIPDPFSVDHERFQNRNELCKLLGCPPGSGERDLYAMAVERIRRGSERAPTPDASHNRTRLARVLWLPGNITDNDMFAKAADVIHRLESEKEDRFDE